MSRRALRHRRASALSQAAAETDGRLRIGIVTFPGTSDAEATARAVRLAGAQPVGLWHGDADLRDVAAVILPGGSAHGDYLRPGALAARSQVMRELIPAADAGLPILGIGNGFQVLCEAGILPGALALNASTQFVCVDQPLRLENRPGPWLGAYEEDDATLVWPLRCAYGRYVATDGELDELESGGQVVLRYQQPEPTGSMRGIAGISNATGNVVGLMPHPDNAIEAITGPQQSPTDGLAVFAGVVAALNAASA